MWTLFVVNEVSHVLIDIKKKLCFGARILKSTQLTTETMLSASSGIPRTYDTMDIRSTATSQCA